jgi:hypothetical protein
MFKNFLLKVKSFFDQDYLLKKKIAKDGYELRDVKQQINPLCEIEATYQGKEIFKQPFFFIMNTYLKDYGFDPETKNDGSLQVTFRWAKGMEFTFPLYVKKREDQTFGTILTMAEAVKLGYFIPPRRPEAK